MISGGLVCGALRSSIMREVWRDLAKGPQSRTISFMFSSQRAWKLFENAVSAYLNERPYGSLNAIEEALFARRQVYVKGSCLSFLTPPMKIKEMPKQWNIWCGSEISGASFVICFFLPFLVPTLWFLPHQLAIILSKPMCHILVSNPCCENFHWKLKSKNIFSEIIEGQKRGNRHGSAKIKLILSQNVRRRTVGPEPCFLWCVMRSLIRPSVLHRRHFLVNKRASQNILNLSG